MSHTPGHWNPEAVPERCGACGELLDRGEPECRVCGEDNSAHADELSLDDLEVDQLGTWSQLKHEIVEKYSSAYTTILSKQSSIKRYVYAEGFAGAGHAFDKQTGSVIETTALRVLRVDPPFSEYHLIEMDPGKAEHLATVTEGHTNVVVHRGDCNEVLLTEVLPRCQYGDYARGLCVLDPYGLSVSWDLLKAIGAARSVEIIFNFMVVGANRNVLWTDFSKVSERRKQLLDRCWGDRKAWTDAAYAVQPDLFGGETSIKRNTQRFVDAYCERLRKVAGFNFVPTPVPMKNDRGATLYYLIFAGPNDKGAKIISDVFEKYRPK